jgi:hypothetical protein
MPPDKRRTGPGDTTPQARPTNVRATATRPVAVIVTARAFRLADLPPRIAGRITAGPAGCWIAGGKPTRDGHARIGGRSAARVVWEHLVGPVSPGLDLDHREDWGCTSRACVFPGHLLPVTHFVNMTRDGARGAAAVNIRKTRCGTCGEPYDLFNTYYKPDGNRDCRNCIRRRTAEYRGRVRAGQPGPLRQAA